MKRIILFLFLLIILVGCKKVEIVDLSDYEIEQMIENLEIVSYTADYEMKTSTVTPKMDIKFYFDYEENSKYVMFKMVNQISSKIKTDFVLKGISGDGIMESIDQVKTCTYPPGFCIDVTDFGKDLLQPEYMMLNTKELLRKADKTYLGTEEIIGIESNCFNLVTKINNQTNEQDVCYHPKYAVLLKSVSEGGKMIITDLDIGRVDSSEFEIEGNDVDISGITDKIKGFIPS